MIPRVLKEKNINFFATNEIPSIPNMLFLYRGGIILIRHHFSLLFKKYLNKIMDLLANLTKNIFNKCTFKNIVK